MAAAEKNKSIVTRFNKEVIEQGNVDAFYEMVAPDFLNHTMLPDMPEGAEGLLFFFEEILRFAFPDLKVEIRDQITEGSKVVTRKVLHGTHRGEFLGIPATNKKVVIEAIDIVRLRNGKIVEYWAVMDTYSIVMQTHDHDKIIY